MYLFYFFIILSLLQLVMFRMPGLLLILVIAYAIYSLVQSFRLRQSTAGAQGNARSSSSSRHSSTSSAGRRPNDDVIDVEYTEYEL